MQLRSDIHSSEAPNASKWSVRRIRSGVTGDVAFVVGIIGLVNESGKFVAKRLKEVSVTKELGQQLEQLLPGAILEKTFSCGTTKRLTKE